MKTAAFFDLDGTLLPPPSLERRFLRHLLSTNELDLMQAVHALAKFVAQIARAPLTALEGNKAYLAGVRCATAEEWASRLDAQSWPFFRQGFHRLEWHEAQGHRIFLISGTLEPLAQAAARALPVTVEVHATRLDSAGHHWTGRICGEHLSSKAKARLITRLAEQEDLDLDSSFAYGDRIADGAMLECVGQPVAVNPSPRLERMARQRGWHVVEWRATVKQAGPAQPFFLAAMTTKEDR
jgi:HAD superfamily hydrolase (TIGR01490 family)